MGMKRLQGAMAFSSHVFYIPNGSLLYGYSRCDGLFGKPPPHLAPWLGGTPPFGPFIILNFVTAPTALIYIFLSYFLNYPPLTNSTTGTSYSIADRFQHERANSLAETLH